MDRVLNDAMDRYAAGETTAFETVYDRLAPRLFAYLVRRTRDRALAEDLMQQTFLHMHGARGTYVTGADVAPWATAIAHRLAIDTFRRRRREVAGADASEDFCATGPDPEAALTGKRAAASMARALDRMPASQRAAFVLLKLEGRSLAEAAALVGKTVIAVKASAHRAYVTLREAASGG